MPRLIDDIRTAGRFQMPRFVMPKLQKQWENYAKRIAPFLLDRDLPVLLIDNVADYYMTGTDQEFWNIERDFPNLAPPYQVCWFEHRMARKIHSKTGDLDISDMIIDGRVGVLFFGLRAEQVRAEHMPEGTHWVLTMELFIDYGRLDPSRVAPAHGPHGVCYLAVDSNGRAIGAPWMQSWADEEDAAVMKSIMTWFNPVLLAISFLHCKNVVIEDKRMDEPLAKKFRAKHGIEPVRFKTLVIEPLKQILRSHGKSDEHGLAKAMHICRGHFKDYREGRGLFGKYHQLVWHPSLVRGTKGDKPAAREIEVKL